jgi:hypothetical protein
VPAAEVAVPETAGEKLLARFAAYLADERGLAAATVSSYLFQVRPFVAAHADAGRWSLLTAGQVARFAAHSAAGLRPRSAQVRANALRALLGFMWREGLTGSTLAGAVGFFAAPAGTAPPRGLSPGQAGGLAEAGQPLLPFRDDSGFETGISVARHRDFHRPSIGQHGLGPVSVAGIAAVTAGRVILLVTQMVIQLAFQHTLDDHLGQLANACKGLAPSWPCRRAGQGHGKVVK